MKKEKKGRARDIPKTVRFHLKEIDQINKKMKAAELTCFSFYAREMLTKGEVKVISKFDAEVVKRLLGVMGQNAKDINKIGSNINQIAKVANSTSKVFIFEVEAVQEAQREIREKQNHIYHTLKTFLEEMEVR